MKTRDYTSIKDELIKKLTTTKDTGREQMDPSDANKVAEECIDGFKKLEIEDPYMLDKYITDHKNTLLDMITMRLTKEDDALGFLDKTNTIKEIPVLLVTTIKESNMWKSYELQCQNMQKDLTGKFTAAFPSQQKISGRTTHRDLLVNTTVNKLMIEAKKNPGLFAQLSDPKFEIVEIAKQRGMAFLQSHESFYNQSYYDKIADYIVERMKEQVPPSKEVGPTQPAPTKQADGVQPEEAGKKQFALHTLLYEENADINEHLGKSVVVFEIENNDDTFVHKAIMEAQASGKTDTELNKHVNGAIKKALDDKRLTPIDPERRGNVSTYSTDHGTLTLTKDKDGKFTLKTSGNFSGVVQIPPEAIEFKDGKTLAVNKTQDPSKSRISKILHEAEAPYVVITAPLKSAGQLNSPITPVVPNSTNGKAIPGTHL